MDNKKILRPLLLIIALMASANIGAHAEKNAKKVAILMFNGVQTIDFSAPFEVFNAARFDVFTVSSDGKSVTSAMGLSVNPKYSFESMPDADIVVIPGGNIGEAMDSKAVIHWVADSEKRAESILSICNGAFIVAETGLLDGHKATTFHRAFDSFQRNYPSIKLIRNQRYVDNGKVVTSAGLASGIDTSLYLVAKHKGLEKAMEVALHLEYDWNPNQGFVRGKLADQHYPQWDRALLEGFDFKKMKSIGDEYRWKNVFAVSGADNENELDIMLEKQLSQARDWNKNKQGDWVKVLSNETWKLSHGLESKPNSMFELTLLLQRI